MIIVLITVLIIAINFFGTNYWLLFEGIHGIATFMVSPIPSTTPTHLAGLHPPASGPEPPTERPESHRPAGDERRRHMATRMRSTGPSHLLFASTTFLPPVSPRSCACSSSSSLPCTSSRAPSSNVGPATAIQCK